MNELDKKLNEFFPGVVVRKDLVKIVKGNAIVPTYVLEYLLGQYCATSDEESINSGIETVKEILRKHYVHRNEANLIRSVIKEKSRHKVIDIVTVNLNEKTDNYEASFSNLGIKKVIVDSEMIKKHPRLLVNGVWCICDIEYMFTEDKAGSPWVLSTLKPIQLSNFEFDSYLESREKLTTEAWIDTLIQSMGFNPEYFNRRTKLLQLVRLIPYCERNYNLIELGPKGTGKSHIYSEFSPHGILISGGEITVPKLFVNNSNGKVGLVGYWDVVAFDEFAGKDKRVDKALVDIMKNYMANKSFSRGVETLGADASMVFVGNTKHSLPHMLKHTDLFEELPDKYYDSAFLDRLHFYLPGWEMDIIRGEMFSDGYGFVVDYLAEILRTLRTHDFSQAYTDNIKLSKDISTRDKDGINKTFSGLMKILYPSGKCSEQEIKELLEFSIEGRKRVKTQLLKIDSTYTKVNFSYFKGDNEFKVKSLEEVEFPQYFDNYGNFNQQHSRFDNDNKPGFVDELSEFANNYKDSEPPGNYNTFEPNTNNGAIEALTTATVIANNKSTSCVDNLIDLNSIQPDGNPASNNDNDVLLASSNDSVNPKLTNATDAPVSQKNNNSATEKHLTIRDNQKGVTYDKLFGLYLVGAKKILITDPYIRLLYQASNLMDLIQTITKFKNNEDEIAVHLITSEDEFKKPQQIEYLERIMQSAQVCGINFSYELDKTNSIHARHILTDTGWKILLDRGLDIYQHYDIGNLFSMPSRMQKFRSCKAFEITYLRTNIEKDTKGLEFVANED